MPRTFRFYPTGKVLDFKMFDSLKPVAAFFLITACAGFHLAAAQTENHNYLPLGRAELGRPFPLKHVAGLGGGQSFARRLDIGIAPAELKFDDEGGFLVLTGRDRAGHAWSVVATGGSPGGVEIYEADLDRNGLRDLVFLAPTGGNGLAPSSHIVVVTFERDTGRPLRFEAEGYFDADAQRIFDLRDMNGDGRAELIYMNFDDGYWITNLYTAADARWRRIKGRFGARSYPLYTRFTNRPNRRAIVPRAGSKPFAPDLSNDTSHLRGRLVSYRWANVSQSEDIELNFETTAGRQVTCRPASWYSSFTLVKDGARGREIFSLAGGEDSMTSALDEIVAGRYEVSLSGRRKAEGCQPEVLWVKMK
ncbi:MAG TPA: hypothetical protein VER76_06300 [Pyrinomonadaceae bacterium]|nr:hypothetical protein [Pyrinomonadaceae bacterium]